MLFIDSLRDLLSLDAPLSLCERQPLRAASIGLFDAGDFQQRSHE